MPTYCFKNIKTDKIIDRVFHIGKVPKSIKLKDGTVCKRYIVAEMRAQHGLTSAEWPIHSNALAVNPPQAKQYEEFAKKHGVPTRFDEKGKPVFTGTKHQRKYCKLIGALNLDSYFG